MRAIKIPYPTPKYLPQAAGRVLVDFPERHLSYAIYDCKEADLARCALEVRKSVDIVWPGKEPARLEIRLPTN